ncbi:MAG: preprotein translocase subunit SecE [Candidatus Eiseniibacteriota bacterium]|jgi:preprotein translocase SecE subunit
MFQRLMQFLREVRLEFSKVTLPSMKELRESTIVVIIAVTIIAAGLAVVDRALGWIIRLLI